MLKICADFKKKYSKSVEVTARIHFSSPKSGVIIVLFGPSGSGKSTILRCFAGLERVAEGVIHFNEEIWLDSKKNICVSPQKREIGYLFQEYALFPHLNVLDNISYGLMSLPKKLRYEYADSIMQSMQLHDLEKRFPKELSGGQQQRVALARTLVCRPKLLLLDEPLSALDESTRETLRIELKALLKKFEIPTIMVTHDGREAAMLADEIVFCRV